MTEQKRLQNDLAIIFLERTGSGLMFKDIDEVREFLEDLADIVESDLDLDERLKEKSS